MESIGTHSRKKLGDKYNDIEGEPALSVSSLRKTYGSGKNEVVAVDNLSFEVQSGTIVGLLGPNGAGKTTAIKSMLGTIIPDKGKIKIFGKSVHENPKYAYHHIGAMFEGSRDAYWRLTVRENLNFFARLNGMKASDCRERHDELLERLDLEQKADQPVRNLSRGMKQKVSLAATLSQAADIVFLDEPTLGLDVETTLTFREELRSLANQRGLTVLLSSHNMDVVEHLCDRVIILSNGRIVADDSVEELLDVFESDAYQLRVSRPIPSGLKNTLDNQFKITNRDRYADVEEFTIQFQKGDLHILSDILREFDCTIRSLERVSPDLEDVFLRIAGDSNA